MKDKIFTILREYSEENGIMASEIFLEEYAEELVSCDVCRRKRTVSKHDY